MNNWTTEWPTEPGFYWLYIHETDPRIKPIMEVAEVLMAGPAEKRFLCYKAFGGFIFPQENRKNLYWGERVTKPEPPDIK